MEFLLEKAEHAAHLLRIFSEQPSVPSTILVAGVFAVVLFTALYQGVLGDDAGLGTSTTFAGRCFSLYVKWGRIYNLLCSPCLRARRKYPLSNTAQIPFWGDLSALYNFVFGYKTTGLFVEVGAYDGESFSNTSGLADLGWTGHYLEPIPQYAAACKRRHAANPQVTVHNVAAGIRDGDLVSLIPAGPFTSADENELKSVTQSKLGGLLGALGWMPTEASTSGAAASSSSEDEGAASTPSSTRSSKAKPRAGSISSSASAGSRLPASSPSAASSASAGSHVTVSANGRVNMRTTKLDSFFSEQGFMPGEVDVMVVDVEGLEWPIFQGFSLAHWRPKTVIVELQEKQARYADNAKVQHDALAIEAYFREADYSVLYKDAINTVFISRETRCVGGD